MSLPDDQCPDCGMPIDGPALMRRCEKRHTLPKPTNPERPVDPYQHRSASLLFPDPRRKP